MYSTVQETMIYGDPLLDMFMRGMNWEMDYKTDIEAEKVGQAAGWNIEEAFYDAMMYNQMTLGRLNGTETHNLHAQPIVKTVRSGSCLRYT